MDIRETVRSTMQTNGLQGYAFRATPVIDALEARETEATTHLIEFATQQGLPREQAEAAIREAGLVVATSTSNGVDEDRLGAIESTLADLSRALRDLRGH